jgi:hypothetical protein
MHDILKIQMQEIAISLQECTVIYTAWQVPIASLFQALQMTQTDPRFRGYLREGYVALLALGL